MRISRTKSGLKVNAIAGTNVVFFGLDLMAAKRKGFRGFALQRYDYAEDELTWMRGMKTFETTEPHPAPGETFSTRHHPVQSFQWADYGAKPGRDYRYTIYALYGDVADLQEGIKVDVEVQTEIETGLQHSMFFNRGSVATQEYARRFANKPPDEAGQGAYDWLSRGLLEALINYIGQAGKGWSIHGAVYEFQWPAVLEALRAATKRGATVKVIYDDIEDYDKDGDPSGPWFRNRAAIKDAKITGLCKPRRNGNLMHNKFFILSRKNKPVAVWTGSTNLTKNGIFGHSNLGHIVEDEAIAASYKVYWDILYKDPEVNVDYRKQLQAAFPLPAVPLKSGTHVVFSPRGTQKLPDALDFYHDLALTAKDALLMTFAFGLEARFKAIYSRSDDVLRMALLEKAVNNPKKLEEEKQKIQTIRNLPNVVVAIGNRIRTNAFDNWLAEIDRVVDKLHVYWIHTKYMLIDPLSANPVVVTGSANFSVASTFSNDENMVIIKGDKRLADIVFGEFQRLHKHYAFREAVAWALAKQKAGEPDDWRPNYLIEDDSWMKDYFSPTDTSGRRMRREYFAGPMSV